jgi:hypothetical protein
MPRVYERKFDWEEAEQLRSEGLSYREIARRLAVTPHAIRRVLVPGERERDMARATAWVRRGTCPDCGASATRHSLDNNLRCRDCAAKDSATSVRVDTLRCGTCREWKPDNAFSGSRAESPFRRGRHRQCAECNTKWKREWRRRNPGRDAAIQRAYRRRKAAA